jgi:hypothetical protein
VVLHHTPAANEALGGTWWWLTVAAMLAFTIWRDVRSWSKPREYQSIGTAGTVCMSSGG